MIDLETKVQARTITRQQVLYVAALLLAASLAILNINNFNTSTKIPAMSSSSGTSGTSGASGSDDDAFCQCNKCSHKAPPIWPGTISIFQYNYNGKMIFYNKDTYFEWDYCKMEQGAIFTTLCSNDVFDEGTVNGRTVSCDCFEEVRSCFAPKYYVDNTGSGGSGGSGEDLTLYADGMNLASRRSQVERFVR